MAKLNHKITNSGFRMVSEGVHVLKIASCKDEYDTFDSVSYTLTDETGANLNVNFQFVNGDGDVNETAVNQYATLAKAAMNVSTDDDVYGFEFKDLVGQYVKGYVAHTKSIAKKGKNAGKELTYANLDIWNKSNRLEHADAPEADDIDDDDLDDLDDLE